MGAGRVFLSVATTIPSRQPPPPPSHPSWHELKGFWRSCRQASVSVTGLSSGLNAECGSRRRQWRDKVNRWKGCGLQTESLRGLHSHSSNVYQHMAPVRTMDERCVAAQQRRYSVWTELRKKCQWRQTCQRTHLGAHLKRVQSSLESDDCFDYLNSAANNLDACKNVKMQKDKNYHFGTIEVQFGTVNFALWDGTGTVRKKVICEPWPQHLHTNRFCISCMSMTHKMKLFNNNKAEHRFVWISLVLTKQSPANFGSVPKQSSFCDLFSYWLKKSSILKVF